MVGYVCINLIVYSHLQLAQAHVLHQLLKTTTISVKGRWREVTKAKNMTKEKIPTIGDQRKR